MAARSSTTSTTTGSSSPRRCARRTVELLSEAQIKRARALRIVIEVPAATEGERSGRFEPEKHAALDMAHDVRAPQCLKRVIDACKSKSGEHPVQLILMMPGGYRIAIGCAEDLKVFPDENLVMDLERIPGVATVQRV